MKLEALSLPELTDIESKLPAIIAAKRAEEADKVRAMLAKAAEKHGFTLVDIFGDAKTRKRVVLPKYRDAKTGKTWSGRGRAPLWMPKRKSEYASFSI